MKISALLALILIGVAFTSGYFAGCTKESKTVTITSVDTVYVEHTIYKEKIKPVFKTKFVSDTTWILDSAWVEFYRDSLNRLLKSKQLLQFIAEVDTSFDNGKIHADIQFVSPIPLHPKSHFNLKINYKETQITRTAIIEPSFWSKLFSRFGIYGGVGLGYTPDNRLVPNANVSFGFRIFP